jgi:hypothetical protein
LSHINALGVVFYRKSVVLRNLEAKVLKTANLRGLMCGMEPGACRPVHEKNSFRDNAPICVPAGAKARHFFVGILRRG